MDDLEKLARDMARMEKYPTKYLNKIVKTESEKVLMMTMMKAPIRTGKLVSGMEAKFEKRKQGKSVMKIGFDSAKNEIFQKPYGNGRKAFYPMLQEYGWKKGNGQRFEPPHKNYMKNTLDSYSAKFTANVYDYMMSRIETAWRG